MVVTSCVKLYSYSAFSTFCFYSFLLTMLTIVQCICLDPSILLILYHLVRIFMTIMELHHITKHI